MPLQNYFPPDSEIKLTTLLDEIRSEHATLVDGKLADEAFVKDERVARRKSLV